MTRILTKYTCEVCEKVNRTYSDGDIDECSCEQTESVKPLPCHECNRQDYHYEIYNSKLETTTRTCGNCGHETEVSE